MTAVIPAHIEVGRLSFEVLPRPQRKTLEITVERDARLTIKTPDGVTIEQIEAFVDAKQDWIYRKLAEKDALACIPFNKEFVNGEGFAYLGRNYRLQLVSRQAVPVKLERGRLRITSQAATDGTAAMRDWYRRSGESWLQKRIQPWAARMSVDDIEVCVIDLGYRWGSTRGNKRINIHWATLQLPPSLIDYILVHEIAHLHETNHTPEFWKIVERAMQDYTQRRSALAIAGRTVWTG